MPADAKALENVFKTIRLACAGEQVDGGAAAEFSVGFVHDDQGVCFLEDRFQVCVRYRAARRAVGRAEEDHVRVFPNRRPADRRNVEGVVRPEIDRQDATAEDVGVEAVKRETGRWDDHPASPVRHSPRVRAGSGCSIHCRRSGRPDPNRRAGPRQRRGPWAWARDNATRGAFAPSPGSVS